MKATSKAEAAIQDDDAEINSQLDPSGDLILHVFYEQKKIYGYDELSQDEVERLYDEALNEFGGHKEAVNGIRLRCGLEERYHIESHGRKH